MSRPHLSPLTRLPLLASGAAVLVLSGCGLLGGGGEPPSPRGQTARATFVNAQGQPAGTATLTSTGDGVFISAQLRSLPEGTHAMHVHQTGRCEPPFESAGGHFNPTRRGHGILNPAGPHVGDLPNMRVDADGTGRLETFTERVTLGTGWNSLLDDARALVIHAAADDHRTDPTGNSGPRLACGVLVKP